MGARFEAAVEDDVLLAAVGDDFNLADDNVFAGVGVQGVLHAGGKRELELADAVGVEGEARAADAAGFDGNSLLRAVVVQRVPIAGLEPEADFAGVAGVVIDGDGNRDAIALGQRDGQVQVHEEVLEDLEA